MFKFFSLLVALTVTSAAFAQGAPHSSSKQKETVPATQKADDPNDIAAVPRDVQKWFGGAVDNILTGAGKVVDPGGDKR